MFICPHCEHELTRQEIGLLYTSMGITQKDSSRRFWRSKLTGEDVTLIRLSKEPIKELAKKYKVSSVTIWRVKENKTFKNQNGLKCPHCGQELTPPEIGRLFASLGGSTTSRRKARASRAINLKRSKLTEEDIANIRESTASTRELARKYEVELVTIRGIRKNKIYKSIPPD